ncbi:hypothetical protein CR513_36446, partial [Mucuna pruriens]
MQVPLFGILSQLKLRLVSEYSIITELKKRVNYDYWNQKSNYGSPNKISNQPDFILGRIVSSISTKDVVCTCVLPKRWIYCRHSSLIYTLRIKSHAVAIR